MWIVYLADNLHEMLSLIFSGNKIVRSKKKNGMSAAVNPSPPEPAYVLPLQTE